MMKQFNPRNPRFTPIGATSILALIAGLSLSAGCTSTSLKPATAPAKTVISGATNAAPPPSLTGAELYAINCNRCHPERSPIERRSTEWKTILTHMRVRANLPAAQARLILQYLQDNSGS